MRIISYDNHDYYDTCKAYDHENVPIYHRKTEQHKFEYSWINRDPPLIEELIPNNFIRFKTDEIYYKTFLILFCGKIYYGMMLEYKTHDYKTDISKIVYNEEDFYKFFEDNKLNVDKILTKDYFTKYTYNRYFAKNNIKSYFAKNGSKYDLEIFRKYNSFIITFKEVNRSSEYHLTVNDILKKYDFFKVFDPFTAYQEINMFVSGFLTNPEKEMPKIPDNLKVQSHGFDKWSFRKMSEKS